MKGMKNREVTINKNNKYFDIFILALIAIITYKIIDNYNYFFNIIKNFVSIISPFIYALVCAYILNPVVNLFEKKLKFNRDININYILLVGSTNFYCIIFYNTKFD